MEKLLVTILTCAVIIAKEVLNEDYSHKKIPFYVTRGGAMLAVNAFAKEKCGNMLNQEKIFYQLVMQGVECVAEEQIAWLGKKKEELTVIDSSYIENRKKLLESKLLKVQNYNLEELSQMKKAISNEFRKDLLVDIIAKNGAFSKEKFEKICERYHLCLEVKPGDDGKKRYYVKEKSE